jgi:nicotinate-nucleotide--dimethylbenzimidazole phosphoribosyltransferase
VRTLVELLATLPGSDERSRELVRDRAARVLRPKGALARLDETAAWLASWQGTTAPSISRPVLIVFAGDHGVTRERVSAYPASVTASVLAALQRGVATANILAAQVGATVEVVDCGVGRPTKNLAREPAMDHERFASCVEQGRRAANGSNADLLVVGEMGIGNTTSAAAVAACLFGLTEDDWTGRGSGIDDRTLRRKLSTVRRACERVGPCEPVECLRQLGGSEMAAIAGAVVEARLHRIPVVLDGFVVTAAVAPLEVVAPGALEHCVAGHRSPEPGHQLLLEKLGKEPLLDLGLRLGEGSGALAAVPLIRMAARAVVDVPTFEEWSLAR